MSCCKCSVDREHSPIYIIWGDYIFETMQRSILQKMLQASADSTLHFTFSYHVLTLLTTKILEGRIMSAFTDFLIAFYGSEGVVD